MTLLASLPTQPSAQEAAATQTGVKSVDGSSQTEHSFVSPKPKLLYAGRGGKWRGSALSEEHTPIASPRVFMSGRLAAAKRRNQALDDAALSGSSSLSASSESDADWDAATKPSTSGTASKPPKAGEGKDDLQTKADSSTESSFELRRRTSASSDSTRRRSLDAGSRRHFNIYESPHVARAQELRRARLGQKATAGIQTDLVCRRSEAAVQACHDVLGDVVGVSRRVKLHEASRVTNQGPAVIRLFATHKLSTLFEVERVDVKTGIKSSRVMSVPQMHHEDVGHLRALAAQHLSSVMTAHKQASGMDTSTAAVPVTMRVLEVVQEGLADERVVLTLRARVDFSQPSHPLFLERRRLDDLLDRQLGLHEEGDAHSTHQQMHTAPLNAAKLFTLDVFVCQKGHVTSKELTLDEVLQHTTNSKIRSAAAAWMTSVRQELRREALSARKVPGSSAAALPTQGAPGLGTEASLLGSDASAETVLGQGKYSDWIQLATLVRPVHGQAVKLSVRMQHRVAEYTRAGVASFLRGLGVPTDLGYGSKSSVGPSQALALVADRVRSLRQRPSLPDVRKRKFNRFVFEAQNLQTNATVSFSATYAELVAAQKYGVLDLADGVISALEAAELKKQLAKYAAGQALLASARLMGSAVTGSVSAPQEAAGLFSSRDGAAAAIQRAFRTFLIRRSMRHVHMLTQLIRADRRAREQTKHKTAMPRAANIRQWLTGMTPWGMGGTSCEHLLALRLVPRAAWSHQRGRASEAGQPTEAMASELIQPSAIIPERPKAVVKAELLEMYLEQEAAYGPSAVGEVDGGNLWRLPSDSSRFIGTAPQRASELLDGKRSIDRQPLQGASVTGPHAAFDTAKTNPAPPSPLMLQAAASLDDLTQAMSSPLPSPRSIQQQLDACTWWHVPEELAGHSTQKHMLADEHSGERSTAPSRKHEHRRGGGNGSVPTPATFDEHSSIHAGRSAVTPYDLLPTDLLPLLSKLLDDSSYDQVEEQWSWWEQHRPQTPEKDGGPSRRCDKLPRSVLDANPTTVRFLPLQRAMQLETASQGAARPSQADTGIVRADAEEYDWASYFAQSDARGAHSALATPSEVLRAHFPVPSLAEQADEASKTARAEQGPVPGTFDDPVSRVVAFNRQVQVLQHPAARTRRPSLSASRQRSSSDSAVAATKKPGSRAGALSGRDKDGAIEQRQAQTARLRFPPPHPAAKPTAKMEHYEHQVREKTALLAKQARAQSDRQLKTKLSSRALNARKGDSQPSWAERQVAEMFGGRVETRQHRPVSASTRPSASYKGVWVDERTKRQAGGQWVTKDKVRLQGFTRLGWPEMD